MKSLNPGTENCRRNGAIGLGLVPGNGPKTINVRVSYGPKRYDVIVPSNSSFGHLKSVITQSIGLKPEMHKLFFRGQEKEDGENLQTTGVEDNSEIVLTKCTVCEQKIPEEVQQTFVTSKGAGAVAEVRKEVDKLEQQVSALQSVVDSGTKVDNKEIIYLTEMLMRQLLKLDGIEAEGEGKVQRKMEVRRVQSIVEILDVLKSRNSNTLRDTHRTVSGTASQEAFSPGCGNVRSVTPPWKTFDPGCESVDTSVPLPSAAPSPMPYFIPSTAPSAVPHDVPSPMPYFTPSTMPYHAPPLMPYFTPSTMPCHAPPPMTYLDQSTLPSSTFSPVPYYVPSAMSSAPFPPPSSTSVTQNWEHFG